MTHTITIHRTGRRWAVRLGDTPLPGSHRSRAAAERAGRVAWVEAVRQATDGLTLREADAAYASGAVPLDPVVVYEDGQPRGAPPRRGVAADRSILLRLTPPILDTLTRLAAQAGESRTEWILRACEARAGGEWPQ